MSIFSNLLNFTFILKLSSCYMIYGSIRWNVPFLFFSRCSKNLWDIDRMSKTDYRIFLKTALTQAILKILFQFLQRFLRNNVVLAPTALCFVTAIEFGFTFGAIFFCH